MCHTIRILTAHINFDIFPARRQLSRYFISYMWSLRSKLNALANSWAFTFYTPVTFSFIRHFILCWYASAYLQHFDDASRRYKISIYWWSYLWNRFSVRAFLCVSSKLRRAGLGLYVRYYVIYYRICRQKCADKSAWLRDAADVFL